MVDQEKKDLVDNLCCDLCGLPLALNRLQSGVVVPEVEVGELATRISGLSSSALQTAYEFVDLWAPRKLRHKRQGVTCNVLHHEKLATEKGWEKLPANLHDTWAAVGRMFAVIGGPEESLFSALWIKVAALSAPALVSAEDGRRRETRPAHTHNVWISAPHCKLVMLRAREVAWHHLPEEKLVTQIAADILDMTVEEIDALITTSYLLAD